MNADHIRSAVVVSTAAIIIGVSVTEYLKVHREEVAKRKEIEKNKNLDIQAIRNSSDRSSKIIEDGLAAGKTLSQIFDDFNNEIEFQKIIIRNQ